MTTILVAKHYIYVSEGRIQYNAHIKRENLALRWLAWYWRVPLLTILAQEGAGLETVQLPSS
jgi:hypothetical protein